ncbi:lactonase family protein [Bauldia sp.]|uniref:lactonase family protein n=1 Tax=Bauldia sp. TaxID=2575872 RepID=UPI003BAB6644
MALTFFVGTYSRSVGGFEPAGEGIHRFAFDPDTGEMSAASLAAKSTNPSYLSLHPNGRILFAVNEVSAEAGSAVEAYAIGETGDLEPLNRQRIDGEFPCHLACDPHGRWLATAQYGTGDFALFPLNADGTIGALATHFKRSGTGPNPKRQEGPHAHYVAFDADGTRLHGVDLGTDRVATYATPASDTSSQAQIVECAVPAGAGPRHMAITTDGGVALVANELGETISILTADNDSGGWQHQEAVEAFPVPAGTDGSVAAIRLSPDERHVYITGRRQSHVAVLAFDRASGRLTKTGETESGGLEPRDMIVTADGRWVLTANQNSNCVVSFSRDAATGALTPSGHEIEIGTPVALLEWR